MAHKEQANFVSHVKSIYPSFFKDKKVLEVGSLNVNGTIRTFFDNCNYTGIDVGPGPGVDIVCPGQDYDEPDNSFDVTCSAECFEHNPWWLETFQNMIRMCKNDGLVFFTCASKGRAEHGTRRSDIGSSPHTIEWDYYRNLEEKDFTEKLNLKDYFTEYKFEYNPYSYDLYFYGIKKEKKKVIDCFPFFNEKELLELRLNLLNEHVDHFIISELNTTHSGLKKDFICQSLVDEYGFTDKVTVLEVEVNDEDLIPNEVDTHSAAESKSAKEVNAWVRERLQRDALERVVNQYNDDDVFILSDCDEIINPEFINYFSSICRSNTSNIIKVPLVLLEGRADKRLYQNNNPVPWMYSLLLCTAGQLKSGTTPTQMRSNNMNSYPPIWITEGNELIQDCGWHFTWMGDSERRVEKAKSFIHYANLNSINTLSSESIESVHSKINTTNSLDSEKHTFYKKDYPLENLPQVIFNLPRVKNFLLPNKPSITEVKNKISKFYTLFDNKFGEWGWCSQEKADAIIDCIFEVCSLKSNPICAEIGVYGGKSLFPFAAVLKQINKGVVYGIDPWTNEDALVGYDHPNHQQFWGNIDLERIYNICLEGISELGVEEFVSIIRETSDDAPTLGEIDVLHIDGQHTEQLIKDINKYAVSVVEGGYCFVDDVEWSQKTLKSIPLMESLGFKKIKNIHGCLLYYREKKIISVEEKLRPFNITLNELRCALGV